MFGKAIAATIAGLMLTLGGAEASEVFVGDLFISAPVVHLPFAVTRHDPPVLIADLETSPLLNLAEAPCLAVATPPVSLATDSKYDPADPTHSVLSATAADSRDATLQPVRNAIRAVVSNDSYRCAVDTVVGWATSGALTRMQSEDAFLTRDRFVAEVAMMLIDARDAGALDARSMLAIRPWLMSIAETTTEFYAYRAGPNSKRNNHRYWAGLSVGAIAILFGDDKMKLWADHSFELGVCQVDPNGHLPLEMARGAQALNYHVYALRPLLAYAAMASEHGDNVKADCNDGLGRLVAATESGLADPASFAKLAGKLQAELPSEKSYSRRLQLTTLGFAL